MTTETPGPWPAVNRVVTPPPEGAIVSALTLSHLSCQPLGGGRVEGGGVGSGLQCAMQAELNHPRRSETLK